VDANSILIVVSIVNLALIIAGGAGVYFILRSSLLRTSTEVQDRIRDGLKEENELLKQRLTRVEEDNRKLNRTVDTIIAFFSQRNIFITVTETSVQFKENGTTSVAPTKEAH